MSTSQNSTASPLADDNPGLPRRAVMSQVAGAAVALMLTGASPGRAEARGRGRGRGHCRSPQTTVEVLPDGVLIQVKDLQILVMQIDEGQIALDLAPTDDLSNPIYTSIHSGVLTEELIDQIAEIGRRGVGPDEIRWYSAMLRSAGFSNLQTDTIAMILGIIIAIIIICAIIGSSVGLGYGDDY